MLIPLLMIIGGVWVTQDAIASILFYLKKDGEHWYFNHAVRVFRGCWGLVFIYLGIRLLYGN